MNLRFEDCGAVIAENLKTTRIAQSRHYYNADE
jgi:hypothetical protein